MNPPSIPNTGTYLISTIAADRRRVFQTDRNARLFIEKLQHYRGEGRYKPHASVVMPDHVHLLITPLGITVERAVGLIKGGFSHRLGSKMPVLQKGFDDHRTEDVYPHEPGPCRIGERSASISVFVGVPGGSWPQRLKPRFGWSPIVGTEAPTCRSCHVQEKDLTLRAGTQKCAIAFVPV